PDHDELFRRIGDDLGYPREAYERIAPVPEMAAIIAFFRRLAHEIPWSAALCATALLEEEVVEIAQTVGRAVVQHYGVRPEWGGMNYTVHEAIEKEESGETKKTILKHLRTPDGRRAAEDAMREMHRLLEAYAQGLARRHLSPCAARQRWRPSTPRSKVQVTGPRWRRSASRHSLVAGSSTASPSAVSTSP